jgi:galactose mutarotase-like enzyme
MRLSHFFSAAACLVGAALATTLPSSGNSNVAEGPDSNGKYWIYGEGIAAAFIPYGASISNLVLKDKNGVPRDVIMGFDKASDYAADKVHPHLGGVPGRYANRIKNSTFEIDGVAYHITANENPTAEHPDGLNTLHGGKDGWDWRDFDVAAHTNNSITFSIVDPDGKEGFPGEVISYITYTMGDMTWNATIIAIATTKKTPIMLTSHTYWNLDGFANNETSTVFNHTFHLPYSGQRVAVDNILIPTGDILANAKGSVNDFWSAPKQIGQSFDDPEIHGNCGFNCTGYGTCPVALFVTSSPRSHHCSLSRPHSLPAPFLAFLPKHALTHIHRQLLARQPPHCARLARRRRLRGQPLLRLVRHQGRHLLGPGRLPDVLVRRAERVVPAQGGTGRRPPLRRRHQQQQQQQQQPSPQRRRPADGDQDYGWR